MIKSQKKQDGSKLDSQLLESLIQMGLQDEAFNLMDKCDSKLIQQDKWLAGAYLNILAEKDMEKAGSLLRDLEIEEIPRPADLFNI